MIRRPPRSTLDRSSAASDVYKRQVYKYDMATGQFSGPFFSAPANGLTKMVDGLHVDGDLP